jgi:hypothetical protein
MGFWPVELYESETENHAPFSTLNYKAFNTSDANVLMGGTDGIIRKWSDIAQTDCGHEIVSYVDYGPIPLWGTDYMEAVILELIAVLAEKSGDVDWQVRTSKVHEAVAAAASRAEGSFQKGLNPKKRVRLRGVAAMIRLSNSENRQWAVERISMIVRVAGKQRP